MIWPIKITYRPTSDKEVTKEIKIDSRSTILNVLMKSVELFDVKDFHNYAILHKKTLLPFFESLEEAKLVQGSTVLLAKRVHSKETYDVVFNYKLYHDSGVVKTIGRYHSNDNFISCLQNLNSEMDSVNILHHASKLPNVGILSGKLSSKDLMTLSNFTLGNLGLKGNYLVTITYTESPSADFSEFYEFIKSRNVFHSETSNVSMLSPRPIVTTKAEDLTSLLEKNTSLSCVEAIDLAALTFKIVSKPEVSLTSPELPDSFYDLTKEELIDFQRALQNSSKSFNLRQSVKSLKHSDQTRDLVPLKLIFPDQLQIHVEFPSRCSVASIVEFITTRIIESHSGEIQLLAGTPYVLLKDVCKSICSSGISGPTRMIVVCGKYSYRKDLHINETR